MKKKKTKKKAMQQRNNQPTMKHTTAAKTTASKVQNIDADRWVVVARQGSLSGYRLDSSR